MSFPSSRWALCLLQVVEKAEMTLWPHSGLSWGGGRSDSSVFLSPRTLSLMFLGRQAGSPPALPERPHGQPWGRTRTEAPEDPALPHPIHEAALGLWSGSWASWATWGTRLLPHGVEEPAS